MSFLSVFTSFVLFKDEEQIESIFDSDTELQQPLKQILKHHNNQNTHLIANIGEAVMSNLNLSSSIKTKGETNVKIEQNSKCFFVLWDSKN